MRAEPRLRDQPGYGRFWAASAISDLGTPVTTLALAVLVVTDLQASATQLGLVNAARWVPYLVFGLLAGVLIDRARRRFRVLVGCDLARALLLGTIPVLYGLDRLSLASVAVVVALFGAVSVLSDAGQQSALPRLVDRRVLTSANARLEQAGAVSQTSGPLLGGLLVRTLGAPFALLADALSYLASGLLLASIRVAEPNPPDRAQRHLGRELREGLAWVYRHPMLAPVAAWGHLWFVFNAMLGTIFVPFALRDLRLSALGLGVAYACAGVGAVVGGALARRAAERLGLGPAVIVAQWLTPAAFALIALARPGEWPLILVGAGQALFGVGIGLSSPNTLGFRQSITPDALQGRMNATIRSLNWGMIAVGAPLGGVLADQLGFRPALWIGVAGFAAASAGLLLSPFRRATAPA